MVKLGNPDNDGCMRNSVRMVFVLVSLLFVGCSKKIDSARFKESIAEVRQSLPEERRKEFSEAVQGLIFQDLNLGALSKPIETELELAGRLHGLTGAEVIEKWKDVKEDRLREQIAVLEQEQSKAIEAQAILSKFVIHDPQFSVEVERFLKRPVIRMKVENQTGQTVAEAGFKGRLYSVGREVPWMEGEFFYKVSGGLQDDEKADWALVLSSVSDWARAPRDKPDMFLVVECVNLKTIQATLADISNFQEKHLRSLQSKRRELLELKPDDQKTRESFDQGKSHMSQLQSRKETLRTNGEKEFAAAKERAEAARMAAMEQADRLRREQEEKLKAQMAAEAKRKADEQAAEAKKRAEVEAAKEARTVAFLRKRIETGSAASAYRLGLRYLSGEGVPVNRPEGIRLLNLAAERGDENAKAKLQEIEGRQ